MSGLLILAACHSALERGEAALDRGDLLTAEQEFRGALADNPDDPEALYGVGWTFHLAHEDAAARDAFEQLRSRYPDSPLGYRGMGSLLFGQGDLAAARVQLDLAVARAPADVRATQSLALLDLAEDKPADALTRMDAAIASAPDSSELHQTRAAVLVQLGRADEALTEVERAADLADNPRETATAELTRARALVSSVEARVDAGHCEGAAAVFAWLHEADLALDRAQATGVHDDQVSAGRRDVRRRRSFVEDACPGAGERK